MYIVCFHNPNEDNGFLSNWYMSDFKVDGIVFSSMEQYMMYKKAILFNDDKIAEKILSISDVEKIKSLGRQVSNYNDVIWSGCRQIVVFNGLLQKFSDKKLKRKLLATQDSILAECAVRDKIWGIGLSMTDKDRYDINKWKGQNLLGFTITQVREELQKN